MTDRGFQIAIDGPVAAGKGTVSRAVADKLGFLYVDTGATYRVVALMAIENGVNLDRLDQFDQDEVNKLVELLKTNKIGLKKVGTENDGRLLTVLLNERDVTWRIREADVNLLVPVVAKIPQVRDELVRVQREIAGSENVVMEGRDVAYRVLPEAGLKIYLDADVKIRARRKLDEVLAKAEDKSFEMMLKEVERRDELDSTREVDPLKKIDEAWYLDTTQLKVSEVVELIVAKVNTIRT